eukprot:29065_1
MYHLLPHCILFASSSVILTILWIISVQQFCGTNYHADKPRVKRIVSICFIIFCFLILNILVYTSALYPHYKLIFAMELRTCLLLFQAFVAMMGFHTFRRLFIHIINKVYTQVKISEPKWLIQFVNVLEIIVYFSISITHTMALICNDMYWIYIFYISFGAQFAIMDILIALLLSRPLKMLNEILQSEAASDPQKIVDAKCKMKGAIAVSVICCVAAVIIIVATVQQMTGVIHWSYSFVMMANILHSIVLILLGLGLVLSIYKGQHCCKVRRGSVCWIWCCEKHDQDRQNYAKPLISMLPSSMATSTNQACLAGNVTPHDVTPDGNISTRTTPQDVRVSQASVKNGNNLVYLQ